MRNNSVLIVIGIAVVLLIAILFVRFKMEPKKYVTPCLEKQTEFIMMPTNIGKQTVMRMQPVVKCGKYGKPELNPRWVKWNEKKGKI